MDFDLKTHHIIKKKVKGHKRWLPRKGRYTWIGGYRRKKKIRGKHMD